MESGTFVVNHRLHRASSDRVSETVRQRVQIVDVFVVLALGFLKFFLVLPAIGPTSLYRDDAWQALSVRVDDIRDVLQTGVTSPGFALLLRFISKADEVSEQTLQAPALLAGILGPMVAFAISRWWGLSRSASIVTAMLLCVAPAHTDYTTRVKPYTLDAIATLVCLAISKSACDAPRKRIPWMLLVVAAVVSTSISATAGLAASTMVLVVAIIRRFDAPDQRWKDLVILLLFGCLLASWYSFVLDARLNVALHEFWRDRMAHWEDGLVQAVKSIAANILRVFASLIPDNTDTALVPSAFLYLVPLAMLYAVLAFAGIVRVWQTNWRYGMVLSTPLFLAVTLCAVGKFPLGGGRTDLYLAPIIAITVGCLLDWRPIRPYAVPLAATLCGVLSIAAGIGARATYPQEDLKSLTADVEERAGSNDRILVFPETAYMYALYSRASVRTEPDPLSMTGFTPKLDDPRVFLMPGFEFGTSIHEQGESACVVQLEKAMSEHPPRIWVVASTYFPEDTLPILDERLKENGWLEESTQQHTNARVRVWHRQ
jgi:MFS family permease